MWNDIDIEGKQYAIEAGYEIIEIQAGDLGEWEELAAKVREDFVQSMVAAGYAEEEVKGWMDFIKERIEYWTEKQKELGVKSSTGPDEVRFQF
jgi:phosphoserine aminotransferase